MEDSAKVKKAKAHAKIRAAKAAKAAKNVPVAILLKKKAECDAKALKIVEMMTEKNIDVNWMLENLGWLNRSHLEDITEERAIVKLCGYPLCDNALTKIINRRYQISRNKLYDVQQTKNYCSHSCYLSTNYLINQMLTSPLWLREEEKKPKFKILDKKKLRGSSPPGVEIKLVTLDLPPDSDEEDVPEKTPTPSNNIDNNKDKNEPKLSSKRSFESQIDKTDDDVNKNDEKTLKNECKKMKKVVSFGENEVREFETIKTDDKNIHDEDDDDDDRDDNDNGWFEFNDDENLNESLEKMVIDDKIETNKTTENPIAVKSIIKKTNDNNHDKLDSKYKSNKNTKKLDKKQKNMSFESLVSHVEESFTQWITDDTITFLHGEPLSKQQVIEKVTRDEKFKEICKKLDLIQIEEEKEARMMTKKTIEMKPLPDYDTLKEESKNIDLKVKAFYQGQIDLSELKIIENKIEKQIDNKTNDTDDSFVPLTDANDAIALRRRIFLNSLNRVVPDLLQTLAGPDIHYLNSPDRKTLIKTLIYTFKLTASNISFKTTEWNLVGLLIIKMLGVIDPTIKNLLSMKKASTYISMILTIYNLSSNYLDILVSSLTSPRNITN